MQLFTILALFLLFACGSDSTSSNKERKVDPVCGNKSSLCLVRPEWVLHSNPTNFPKNFRILVEQIVVNDTCKQTDQLMIVTTLEEVKVSFPLPWVPNEKLEIKLVDLGTDCDNDALFFHNEEVEYEVQTSVVNGRNKIKVSVQLNN